MKKITINRDGKGFSILQKFAKSFLIPISVLPAAGLLLGFSSIFTNQTVVSVFNLQRFLAESSFLYKTLVILRGAGMCIFENLPLLFALGCGIGFAEKDKEISALSSVLSFFVMHVTIHNMLLLSGNLLSDGSSSKVILDGMLTDCVGIKTLQMGVPGGVIVGYGTALIHNKFRNTKPPEFLSFFGGNRTVPIISGVVFIFVGVLFYYVWPPIQYGINFLGVLIAKSGYVGTFFYYVIYRLLIPLGLHHVFYFPFWYSSLGGVAEVGGTVYTGAQSIVFAQIADPSVQHIGLEYARFFSGEYPIMIFALPAMALAMLKNVKPEFKKKAKPFLVSALFTCLVTGITEPIELPLMYANPLIYFVHALFTGVVGVVSQILKVAIGCTFSDGLIDFILFGVMPGNAKTGWLMVIPIGVVCFVLYYFLTDFIIRKLNLKTPGRVDFSFSQDFKDDDYTNVVSDYEEATRQAELIISGLGGKENIEEVDCCATRLRCTVRSGAFVDQAKIEKAGSYRVIVQGASVQAVFGPSVGIIKSNVNEMLETGFIVEEKILQSKKKLKNQNGLKAGSTKKETKHGAAKCSASNDVPKCDKAKHDDTEKPTTLNDTGGGNDKTAKENKTAQNDDEKSDDNNVAKDDSAKSVQRFFSPLSGKIVKLENVDDPVFSQKILGDGIAIEPDCNALISPCSGKIIFIAPTKHSVGFECENGLKILIHLGLDTVKLNGKGFECLVKQGDEVKKGDVIIKFDLEFLKSNAKSMCCPIIATELPKNQHLIYTDKAEVHALDDELFFVG